MPPFITTYNWMKTSLYNPHIYFGLSFNHQTCHSKIYFETKPELDQICVETSLLACFWWSIKHYHYISLLQTYFEANHEMSKKRILYQASLRTCWIKRWYLGRFAYANNFACERDLKTHSLSSFGKRHLNNSRKTDSHWQMQNLISTHWNLELAGISVLALLTCQKPRNI